MRYVSGIACLCLLGCIADRTPNADPNDAPDQAVDMTRDVSVADAQVRPDSFRIEDATVRDALADALLVLDAGRSDAGRSDAADARIEDAAGPDARPQDATLDAMLVPDAQPNDAGVECDEPVCPGGFCPTQVCPLGFACETTQACGTEHLCAPVCLHSPYRPCAPGTVLVQGCPPGGRCIDPPSDCRAAGWQCQWLAEPRCPDGQFQVDECMRYDRECRSVRSEGEVLICMNDRCRADPDLCPAGTRRDPTCGIDQPDCQTSVHCGAEVWCRAEPRDCGPAAVAVPNCHRADPLCVGPNCLASSCPPADPCGGWEMLQVDTLIGLQGWMPCPQGRVCETNLLCGRRYLCAEPADCAACQPACPAGQRLVERCTRNDRACGPRTQCCRTVYCEDCAGDADCDWPDGAQCPEYAVPIQGDCARGDAACMQTADGGACGLPICADFDPGVYCAAEGSWPCEGDRFCRPVARCGLSFGCEADEDICGRPDLGCEERGTFAGPCLDARRCARTVVDDCRDGPGRVMECALCEREDQAPECEGFNLCDGPAPRLGPLVGEL